jgi:hypothetical protein
MSQEPKKAIINDERKAMKVKFDELAKGMARSATRRDALKKFGVGLAGMALACFGLAGRAEAAKGGCQPAGVRCRSASHCCSGNCYFYTNYYVRSRWGTCR